VHVDHHPAVDVYEFVRAKLELAWLSHLLTHPVNGLKNYAEMRQTLTTEKGAIKVFVNMVTITGYRKYHRLFVTP